MTSEWHTHDRPQLLFCVSGALRLRTSSTVALLPPDRAAWIPAGCRHQAHSSAPVSLRTVWFAAEPPQPDPIQVFPAPPLLRELAREIARWGPEHPNTALEHHTTAALRQHLDTWRTVDAGLSLPAATDPDVQRALESWLQHLHAPIGVEDAARQAGMSVRTLQRRCKTGLPITLRQWLRRARMLRARELLTNPSTPIVEVAIRCGYASQAAFTRAFTTEVGQTPSAWRQERAS